MPLTTGPGTDVPRPAVRKGRPGPDPEDAAATMRAAGYEPLVPYPGSNVPWPSVCLAAGHAVSPRYAHARNGHGCKFCLYETRRALRTDPDQAAAEMRAGGFDPQVPFPGTNQPWASTCTNCGRTVTPRLTHVRTGTGCAYCSGCATDDSTRLAVMRAAGHEPAAPYPGNNKTPWPSVCLTCGTDTSPRYDHATHGDAGCPACAGRMRPAGAEAELRAAGFVPREPFPGVTRSWPSTCTACGKDCTPSIERIRLGRGCIHCAGKTVDPDLAADRMLTAGYRPLDPYPGRNTARWRCECQACGAHVRPSYKKITAGQGAACCHGPFHLDHPSKSLGVYLVVHDGLGAVKVGIGSATDRTMPRIATHLARGWRVHWQRTGLRSLYVALDTERAVLDAWRAAGLPPYLAGHQMPQAGWTETAELAHVDLAESIRLAEETIAQLTTGNDCV